MKITAYFDGACEPVNPGGYAGIGAIIFKDDEKLWEYSSLIDPKKVKGKTSNNLAEYLGFNSILEALILFKYQKKEIHIYSDSQLVTYQHSIDPRYGKKWKMLKGIYLPHAFRAKELLVNFTNLKLHWIPREENSIADELSKRELKQAGVKFRIQPE